jgi:hypothetical protein
VVGNDPVEPGPERSLVWVIGGKRSDHLDEDLLRDIFGCGHIAGHTERDVVDPGLVPQYQVLQVGAAACQCPLDEVLIFGYPICLSMKGLYTSSSRQTFL